MGRLRAQYGEPPCSGVEVEGLSTDGDDAAAELELRDHVAAMRAELAELPFAEREVLTLFHLGELSLAEVATVLEVPQGTVESRLFRARRIARRGSGTARPRTTPSTGRRLPEEAERNDAPAVRSRTLSCTERARMDITEWSPRLPALLALLQVPWFLLLSIARVRAGGTSALPQVRRIDRLIPLPAFAGAAIGVTQLVGRSWHGGPWLWVGGLACVGLSALFLRVMLR